MEKVIKVALAGYGMSGDVFHAPFLMTDARFELAMVYERTTRRAQARFPSIKGVNSFEALLESDVEVIVLCLPNDLHAEMAERVLQAGKAVVVEKPLCARKDEAKNLFNLAEKANKPLFVYQNRRWDGEYRTAAELVRSGSLGEVISWEARFQRWQPALRAAWKEKPSPAGGIIYDLGSHQVDQVVALFGTPKSVWCDCAARREGSKIEDDCVIHLIYPGMRCTLTSAKLMADGGPILSVYGRQGSYLKYTADLQEEKLKQGLLPVGPDWGKDPEENWGSLTLVEKGDRLNRRKYETQTGDYHFFYDAVYRTLREGVPFPVTAEQATTVIRILEACKTSVATGEKIEI